MNLSQKARKAVAASLAVSTIMWAAAFTVTPVSAAPHSEGCLVNVSGTVYKIMSGQKRGFTSAEVFMSHGYNFGQVVTANSDDASLPTGAIQIYANGTLVKGPNDPLVYLVVNGQKRGFTSGAVFTGLGYSFANIQWAPVNTFTDIPTGANINSTSETGLPMGGPGPQTVSCSTGSMPSDDLEGTTGDITVTASSTYSSEEVGEGDENVEVLSFDVEADEESDVMITSIRVELEQTNSDDSDKLTDYMSEVTVWLNGEEVGSSDVEDFNEDTDRYSKSISLSGAIVRAGEEEEFVVAVSALDNLESTDIDTDVWDVELDQVRFVDGDGVTTTETITANAIDQDFDFASFATANDVELRFSLNDDEDAINEAHNILVDEDDDTDDVELLAFTLEAEGDSDVNVDELSVLFTTSDSDIATVVTSVDLYHDSTLVDSQNITGGATTDTVEFEDLDLDIDAGDTEMFTVKANLLESESNYAQGATLKAEITATQVALTEATDETNEDLASADLTGTALGEASSLFSNGITVEVLSADTTITATDAALGDTASFTWELEITNVGDDAVYINRDAADIVTSSASTDVDMVYAIEQSGSNALTSISGTVADDGATEVSADASAYLGAYSGENFYKLASGETEIFTITVIGTNGTAAGQVRAYLSAIEWTTDDITAATAQDAATAVISSYTAQLATDSETPYEPVN